MKETPRLYKTNTYESTQSTESFNASAPDETPDETPDGEASDETPPPSPSLEAVGGRRHVKAEEVEEEPASQNNFSHLHTRWSATWSMEKQETEEPVAAPAEEPVAEAENGRAAQSARALRPPPPTPRAPRARKTLQTKRRKQSSFSYWMLGPLPPDV